MNIADIAKELNEYVAQNPNIVANAGVYSPEITLNKYCKTITAVKGKFPQFTQIMTRVVQGYKAEWQKLGEESLIGKKLENFHQKVNFEINPSEVLNSWLAFLYVEGMKADQHPISRYIIADLMAKTIDDLEDLSQTAEYDATNASGNYGFSLNGISKVIINALNNGDHPAFKIPLNAITDANILDEISSYEFQLPKKTRKKVKYLYMSDNMKMRYQKEYELVYGRNVNFTADNTVKSPLLKLEIVGLPNIADDVIFATVEENMIRLIDVYDKPAITDIQILDYVVKIFMEFWLGYDFMINELVYVAVFDGSHRGLGDDNKNILYYDSENLHS